MQGKGRGRIPSLVTMAGRRPLTDSEERQLLRVLRRLNPRDAALVATQWLTGFRISECLSLKLGDVLRAGVLVQKIGISPRRLKGGYGRTRWVPVLPELTRALERFLRWLKCRMELVLDMPLFVSREADPNGNMRALSRESARRIVHNTFAKAGILDDGRLGTHTLRKTFARQVYQNSGNDIMILKAALGHSDVSVTQKYLEVQEDDVMAAICKCDRSRPARKGQHLSLSPEKTIPTRAKAPAEKTEQTLFSFYLGPTEQSPAISMPRSA